jgi:hypothetical protein
VFTGIGLLVKWLLALHEKCFSTFFVENKGNLFGAIANQAPLTKFAAISHASIAPYVNSDRC